MEDKPLKHENGTRTGWLFNYHNTSESIEGEDGKEASSASAIKLLFLDHDGDTFEATLKYQPYFLVSAIEGHEREVELGITSVFGSKQVSYVQQIEKEDLDLVNHLSGKKRAFLKVVFANTNDLTAVRSKLEVAVKRNQSMSNDENPFSSAAGFTAGGLFGFDGLTSAGKGTHDALAWMSWIRDIHEYDVKFSVRVAIDCSVYVGLWYDVTVAQGHTSLARCDDSKYAPAMPKVVAFDIETTKAPLKFPQVEVDQIYMISYMIDGRGFLIVNREIVGDDIGPFEYSPRPEYEGHFDTFNEPDEYHTLRRFYDEMKRHKPNVYVTYNGDYFDFPFIHARSQVHGMDMRREIGFAQGAEGATLNQRLPHIDCFYWVKRDSYLPQGSQGLKAVTKYKLGFDPIEVDPEEMLPLAQSNPQRMASYSCSDAVSTYYLYMKYVHPFIFSLCTIIPMQGDEVLRRGSGTLCESLLMVQAYAKNVVFPCKQQQVREKFHGGHLIDSETYIGGRVEALKSGVYRSNIDMHFKMNPAAYQGLIDKLDEMLTFAIEIENGTKREEIANYDEVKQDIQKKLEDLRDRADRFETPLIYHLDVGAMYPNIILTNRLQPSSMVTPDICAGCCFNTPNNEHKCKRDMTWVWKGELFTANRHEYARIKSQLESESFAPDAVAKADIAAVQKKTYGNRSGNVLEGTSFDKPKDDSWKTRKKDGSGSGGYRQFNEKQKQEAQQALLKRPDVDSGDDGGDSEDEDGMRHFNKLQENTQFSMLKKRLAEYCRRAYGKVHESKEIRRTNTVCQRENSFYVDTVRLFRDRRYEYKAGLKKWKANLDKATDPQDIKVCKSRCVQMESLQLAHKCILNSFYGYVMRKGSRWYSMEMAGIVTYLGATLIQVARTLVQQIGETLELDTDGIWCCLPKSFPENFTFLTKGGKKVSISFPCVMLNKDVHDIYSNHQYQEFLGVGDYRMHSECSIAFEVDGPYLAMILPASREEGKSIKKRYAVFHPDGRLAELKGFELKRRGELMLIKDFQSQVFKRFLEGTTLQEAFAAAAIAANSSLDLLYNRGDGYDPEEVIEKLTESSNMTRRLAEYPETQKSLALTTARRIAEFLGPQMVKDKGLACHFVISRMPHGRPVTERTIPLTIFKADPAVRVHFLRKWTGDNTLGLDAQLKDLLDWDYYIARFNGCVQKIITIPAALQGLPNPVPRVPHPDWLHKRVQQQASRFKQVSLTSMFGSSKMRQPAAAAVAEDLEDLVGDPKSTKQRKHSRVLEGVHNVSDNESDEADENHGMAKVGSDDEAEEKEATSTELASAALQQAERERERLLKLKYMTPGNTRPIDTAFFGDEGFAVWQKRAKEGWLHRVKLRKEILGDSRRAANPTDTAQHVASAMDSLLVDTKTKALSHPWHIVEVRSAPDASNVVVVFAVIERSLHHFRVAVPRTVIADADEKAVFDVDSKVVTGRVLPRRKATSGRLVELTVGDVRKESGDTYVEQLRYLRDDVTEVYEADVSAAERFILHAGSVASVRGALHMQHIRDRHGQQRDLYHISEFDACSTQTYLSVTPSGHGSQLGNAVFLYHVATDNRGIFSAFHVDACRGVVVVLQPAGAQRTAFQWSSLVESALETVGLPAGSRSLNPVVLYEAEAADAWRHLSQFLVELSNGQVSTRPLLAVVQSPLTNAELTKPTVLPHLHTLPMVRTMGTADDEKLLQDAFRWSRLLTRRLVQRFFAAGFWIEERLQVSRVAGVPLANLSADVAVSALDVMFRRHLKRRGHVLWDRYDISRVVEVPEERARQVVVESGHYLWCIELSLSQIDVISVLFSQTIQEGDDPSARVLADRGVSSHFLILRDMLSDLMGQAVAGKKAAATLLLVSFARWLHDTSAACYEPRLVELVSTFVHRALTALLIRVTKLGGKVVRANGQSLLVASSKLTLKEAVNFAQFLCTSLKDQPLLSHLHLQPTRYWCPLLCLHHHDIFGTYIAADKAHAIVSTRDPGVQELTEFSEFTILQPFTPAAKERYLRQVRTFFGVVTQAKESVLEALSVDSTVTLATRAERMQEKITTVMSLALEGHFQGALLDEIRELQEQRLSLFLADHGGGSHAEHRNVSASLLEYVKALCYLLELMPGASVAIRKTKNNCLRVCNVGPFSPTAVFKKSFDVVAATQLLDVRCSYCNEEGTINVAAHEKAICKSCAAVFPTDLIEAELVRRVTRLLRAYCDQDYVCIKCRQATASLMSSSCCGELVGKASAQIHRELAAIAALASDRSFTLLSECATFAKSCVAE